MNEKSYQATYRRLIFFYLFRCYAEVFDEPQSSTVIEMSLAEITH